MSESDNKVFSFGIGGFSQRHPPSRSAGTETPTPTAAVLRFSRTRKSAGGRWTSRRSMRPWHSCTTSTPTIAARIGGGPQWKQDATSCTTLDAFVHASPEYVSYGDILAQYGPELDIEQIANRDMSEVDAKLVVSSIIAVARYDHRCVARVDAF